MGRYRFPSGKDQKASIFCYHCYTYDLARADSKTLFTAWRQVSPKAITLCRNSLKITIALPITLLRRKCELDFSHRENLGGIYLSSKRAESCLISTQALFVGCNSRVLL